MTNISELGSILLFAALMVSVMQAFSFVMRDKPSYSRIVPALSLSVALIIGICFVLLMYAFAISDFSVSNVYMNSHSLKPMIYKITGTWGNHEGSMLLWCVVLTLYGAGLTLLTKHMPLLLRARALHVMGAIQVAIIGYTLLTSNPFMPIWPVPVEGMGLNPLLQDIGLAIHPPLLYVGYVGFAAVFSIAIAALTSEKIDNNTADIMHSWIMIPWAFLTLGIGVGSWWAYRELGWGGWWFWDPVENASLLPWLTATALFHSNLVMKKHGNLQRWVLLLAILTFILSLLGTFLVRSGVLTSVHSFANDPTRGIAILCMISAVAAIGLYAYFRHGHILRASSTVSLRSKDMAILCNNLLLVIIMISILLAMIYPLIIEAWNGQLLSIGTNYYNASFALLSIPLIIVCALSTFLSWRVRPTRKNLRKTGMIASVSFIISGVVVLWSGSAEPIFMMGIFAGVWLLLSTVMLAYRQYHIPTASFGSISAMVLGHIGLAIFVLAVTVNATFKQHYEFVVSQEKTLEAGAYQLKVGDITFDRAKNYVSRSLDVTAVGARNSEVLYPEERYFPVEDQFTVEASIISLLTRDLYSTVKRLPALEQDAAPDPNKVALQFHINPAMSFLWGSMVLVAISGIVTVVVRRRKEQFYGRKN